MSQSPSYSQLKFNYLNPIPNGSFDTAKRGDKKIDKTKIGNNPDDSSCFKKIPSFFFVSTY